LIHQHRRPFKDKSSRHPGTAIGGFMQAIRNLGLAGLFGLLITAAPMLLGFLSFAFLTAGWLAVATGMKRMPS
jgi:hypothetical protein